MLRNICEAEVCVDPYGDGEEEVNLRKGRNGKSKGSISKGRQKPTKIRYSKGLGGHNKDEIFKLVNEKITNRVKATLNFAILIKTI